MLLFCRYESGSSPNWNICLLAGKLEKGAVLKAICSGFEETTDPAVCLSGGMYLIKTFQSWFCVGLVIHSFILNLISLVRIFTLWQMWRQMSAWKTMVVAGEISLPISLHARWNQTFAGLKSFWLSIVLLVFLSDNLTYLNRTRSVGGYVSVPWSMGCSSKEMVIQPAKVKCASACWI